MPRASRAGVGGPAPAHLAAGEMKAVVEKLVTALKQEDLQEPYDLTVDELLRLGREEGLAKGLAKGRAEERARRLADLREMARAVLPVEVAEELEAIDDPDVLRQELVRRVRHT